MRNGASLAALGAALALFASAGSAQAQDSAPAVSRDTSRAAKVRADTVSARDTAVQGYRARLSGNCAVAVTTDTSAARAASRDTTARDTTARDTTAIAAISDSTTAQTTRDSLAAIRSAEAAGVYRAPTPPPVADSAAVPCDTTGAPTRPDGTRTDSLRSDPASSDTTQSAPARPRSPSSLNSETTRETSTTRR